MYVLALYLQLKLKRKLYPTTKRLNISKYVFKVGSPNEKDYNLYRVPILTI